MIRVAFRKSPKSTSLMTVAPNFFDARFPISTDRRPSDGVYRAARPVGQLVNTPQHANDSHPAAPWRRYGLLLRVWPLQYCRAETPPPRCFPLLDSRAPCPDSGRVPR